MAKQIQLTTRVKIIKTRYECPICKDGNYCCLIGRYLLDDECKCQYTIPDDCPLEDAQHWRL